MSGLNKVKDSIESTQQSIRALANTWIRPLKREEMEKERNRDEEGSKSKKVSLGLLYSKYKPSPHKTTRTGEALLKIAGRRGQACARADDDGEDDADVKKGSPMKRRRKVTDAISECLESSSKRKKKKKRGGIKKSVLGKESRANDVLLEKGEVNGQEHMGRALKG